MISHWENTGLFCFSHSNNLLSVTFSRLLELTQHPSRLLNSPGAWPLEIAERVKETVRCSTLGAEVSGHRKKQLTQTLIVLLWKTCLFFR